MNKLKTWWNKPITWGDSVKSVLWSIPISIGMMVIADLFTGCYGFCDLAKDKVSDLKAKTQFIDVDPWIEAFQKGEL